jgi:integrase
MMLPAVTTREIQSWITDLLARKYAAHTIAHFYEVLSSVLNTAVKWGEIKREKWILTPKQAGDLAAALSPKPRMMVVLALTTGMRRGELLALHWRNIDEENGCLRVSEAVYPLAEPVLAMLGEWKLKAKRTSPEGLVFGTRAGKPSPWNNILNRQIAPACVPLTCRDQRGLLSGEPIHRGPTGKACRIRSRRL